MKKIKGKPASSGIISGKALVFNSQKEIILREKINRDEIGNEIKRLNNAITKTRAQLKKIYNNLQKVMGKDSALIIETQYLLLKEANLINDIKNLISTNLVKVEWAIKEVEKKYIDFFNNIPDLSFREKRNDISDLLNRLMNNLKKGKNDIISNIENVILIADDLPPSMAANLISKGKLLGLILDGGGETSHSVILARTLEIPTILNTDNATEVISNDDLIIIDGLTGEIYINPTKSVISKYSIKKEKYQVYRERLKEVIKLSDTTKDNHPFNLLANIELPFESDIVQSYGAKGIGLYRTEFLFSDHEISLSTKQQYLIYKNIAQKVFPNPLVIRTFDIGRDKNHFHNKPMTEPNPALGNMAVRLLLKEKHLFKTQIKAILMANESGNIKILFPMITEIEEIYSIQRIIEECKEELKKENKYPNKDIEMGIMIEVPGMVEIVQYLKDEVDFFSIGTNDLMQYLLAADRNNGTVAYLLNPFHPAVIKVLLKLRKEITRIGKKVTVCGEIAGKTFPALMLLGMGYTDFSMNPISIPEIKRIFTNIHFSQIRKIVRQLTDFSSKTEAEEFLIETLLKKYPNLFIKQAVF
ncbi:MAG: phosphoenolpyruvate--protein phosphotransferase [Candidatus Aminicenantes bacterium]|nr:phosphoenolpyruvate--protein phosphotransferase [Candidatus Aminicenantes bacterium]